MLLASGTRFLFSPVDGAQFSCQGYSSHYTTQRYHMYTWDHVHMDIEPSRLRTVFLDHYHLARIWPQQTHTKLMVLGVRPDPSCGFEELRLCAYLRFSSLDDAQEGQQHETRSSSYNWRIYAALLRYCQHRPYQHNSRLSQLHRTERSSLSVVLNFSSNWFASQKPPQHSL